MIALTIPVMIMSLMGSYKAMACLSIPSVVVAVLGMITILYYSIDKISTTEYKEDPKLWDTTAVFGRIGLMLHIFASPTIVSI